jgi:hypothetical protein
MLLKMSILKMSSNTEIREKGECAAVRAVGQGLWQTKNHHHQNIQNVARVETND